MNLAQLRTDLLAILNRNDCTTDLANRFINLAQSRIERTLRVPGQEQITIATGNDSSVTPTNSLVLPQDFLSLKHMYSGSTLMENKDIGHFLGIPQALAGDPKYYCRVGAAYLVKPTVPQGSQVVMVYYATQPVLTNDTDSNFFTGAAADLLLYGALSYACDYFVDDRTAAYESRFAQLYSDIEEQGRMTDMDQSAQAVSPAYNMEY